jgi:hypothetical protein
MTSVLVGAHGIYQLRDISFSTGAIYDSIEKKARFYLKIWSGSKLVEEHEVDRKIKDKLLTVIGAGFECVLKQDINWYFAKWFFPLLDDLLKEVQE